MQEMKDIQVTPLEEADAVLLPDTIPNTTTFQQFELQLNATVRGFRLPDKLPEDSYMSYKEEGSENFIFVKNTDDTPQIVQPGDSLTAILDGKIIETVIFIVPQPVNETAVVIELENIEIDICGKFNLDLVQVAIWGTNVRWSGLESKTLWLTRTEEMIGKNLMQMLKHYHQDIQK